MKVIVPKSVEKYMTVTGGRVQSTKFRLRILSKRFGKRYTLLRLSPTIAPLPPAPPKAGAPPALNPGVGPAPLPGDSYPPFDTESYAFYGSPLPPGPLVELPPPPPAP